MKVFKRFLFIIIVFLMNTEGLYADFIQATVRGNIIVTDSTTGLIWTKTYSTKNMWTSALIYCETLNYAGYINWRLPTINELHTLVNRNKSNPSSDFPDIPESIYFWSSTTVEVSQGAAFTINIFSGNWPLTSPKNTSAAVAICVM